MRLIPPLGTSLTLKRSQFSVGQSLTVPTYRSDLNGTQVPGNKAQCAPSVTSVAPIVPGQYPLAAVDGSNATYWRPYIKTPTSLYIDLGSTQTIKGFHLNFNENPPTSFSVYAGVTNTTEGLKQVVKMDHVKITAPYDPLTAEIVQVRQGNTSDVTLAKAVKARFVQLVVEGAQTDDGTGAGATVSEIAVL